MAETLHKSDLKDKNGENNGRKAGIDRWTQYFEQGIFRDPGSDEFGRITHECGLWFLNIMFKILEEEQPDYLTVAFDVSEPTFRHKMFAEYKGTRKPMAQELREQVPLMKEMLRAMESLRSKKAVMRRMICLEPLQNRVNKRADSFSGIR